MVKFDLTTGLRISQVHTPEERARKRLLQLRIAVWAGITGLAAGSAETGDTMIMVTLTYRGIMDWGPRQIKEFTRWAKARGSMGWVWVAELQKRGAVHYHVLLLWPRGEGWVKPSNKNGGWSKGFTWVTPNVRYPYYLMKYIQKGTKDGRKIRYPKGIHIYAVSRGAKGYMPPDVADTYRAIHLPSWYRVHAKDNGGIRDWSRVSGGISRNGFTCLSPMAETVPVVTSEIERTMWYNFACNADVSAQ